MAAHNPITDTDDFIDALGTDTDAAIGRRFGVSDRTVHAHRQKLGVPSFRRTSKGDRIEALLGRGLSDSEIARRAGVDRAAVRRRREKRGIANDAAALAEQRIQAVLTFKDHHPDASIRTIARETGVGKSRVAKILKDHASQGSAPTKPMGKTVRVWALFAYDDPSEANDPDAYSAATYRMRREDLPFSGWLAQGFAVEVARQITVPEGSPYHQAATS